MKNNSNTNQPKAESLNTRGVEQVAKKTYKPRTPITKTYMKILNDPFVFTV